MELPGPGSGRFRSKKYRKKIWTKKCFIRSEKPIGPARAGRAGKKIFEKLDLKREYNKFVGFIDFTRKYNNINKARRQKTTFDQIQNDTTRLISDLHKDDSPDVGATLTRAASSPLRGGYTFFDHKDNSKLVENKVDINLIKN